MIYIVSAKDTHCTNKKLQSNLYNMVIHSQILTNDTSCLAQEVSFHEENQPLKICCGFIWPNKFPAKHS